jgi:F-type H+-transporting ATPase subunit delta
MTNKLSSIKIADPYAEAFFQLSLSLYIKNNDPDLFYQLIFDIQDFLELLQETPELNDFLKNPLNSNVLKKNILNKVLENKFNLQTINFLNLLVDKKRIDTIEDIGKRFLEKAYEFVCIKFVEVWSTIELNQKQQENLIQRINMVLGPIFTKPSIQFYKIQLTLMLDKNLLGGLVIKMGSKVIDLSLRNELQQLGKKLDITI